MNFINKKIIKEIKTNLKRFKTVNSRNIFEELCFCILVANNNAERTYKIWNEIKNRLKNIKLNELKMKLKKLKYRFYNRRAEYIIYNRKYLGALNKKIKELKPYDLRDWIVKNLKGIGYKEASHFLRNIGIFEFAILDRHILKFLFKTKIIEKIPKNLNKKNYLEIEKKFLDLAKKSNLNPAELDFYIFYLEKGTFPIK